MLFTFVIRNDKITLGFFSREALVGSAAIGTDLSKTADEYALLLDRLLSFRGFLKEDFEGAIFTSVVPALTETLREAVRLLFGFRAHLIGSGTKTGLSILTDNPAELGGDLVASAVGALLKYAPPLILVELGTAVTFSVLDQNGAFVGCAIAPGIALSAAALSSSAELLPHATPLAPKAVIGKNTTDSLRGGTVFGAASMIDGMIERIEEQLGASATVVCAGEETETVLPHCRHQMIKDDALPLYGLEAIYRKNQKKTR